MREYHKKYSRSLKAEVLSHYDNGSLKCSCCGEKQLEFLTLDHVNNDGAKDRRKRFGKNKGGGGLTFYLHLKKEGYPKGFQVLCMNCNFAKRYENICPHIEMREALDLKHQWQRYIKLEYIKRLKEEGRELLGEIIYIQPKRDGENISLWLEGTDTEVVAPHVSSHNMVNADPAIISRFTVTPEFERAIELLRTEKEKFNKKLILFGELVNKGKFKCKECGHNW